MEMQRIDYWRGFSGGFLAGVAVGALIYFSPNPNKKYEEIEGVVPEQQGDKPVLEARETKPAEIGIVEPRTA